MTTGRYEPGACDASGEVPTCSTGPIDRLTWTLRELADLVRHREGMA